MKVRSLFIIAIVLPVAAMAQNKQIIYGLSEAPQSLMLNPGGKAPQKAHFGIPFLSQIHLNVGSSGVSVFDIFGNSSVDINDRIESKINEMTNKDFFTATQQLELFNFGWRASNEIYFSGGIYQEFDFISYFPKDLALLAWNGNADAIGRPFDLGEVSATADVLTVYHFGANKNIGKRWIVGARAKIYSSILSAQSVNNKGTFVTEFGDADSENIYEHRVEDVDITVNTSGVTSLDNASAGSIMGRALFGGNLGVGVDLGVTHKVTDRITASASVLDLGVIFHSKDVESYRATGDYTLDGIELIFPPLSAGQPTLPYYEDLEDEIERELPIDTITSGYTQLRPLKTNASVSYNFGKFVGGAECDCLHKGDIERTQAAGLQLYSIVRPKGPQLAGSLFYYRRIYDLISIKATYTVDSYSFSNVGLGLVADIGKFNFYVAADNILKYGNIAKAKSVSLQLGLNIKIAEE